MPCPQASDSRALTRASPVPLAARPLILVMEGIDVLNIPAVYKGIAALGGRPLIASMIGIDICHGHRQPMFIFADKVTCEVNRSARPPL